MPDWAREYLISTSTLHGPFSLHTVSGRNTTLVTGGAEAGAYVGTAWGPPLLVEVGDALGEGLGGVGVRVTTLVVDPRCVAR